MNRKGSKEWVWMPLDAGGVEGQVEQAQAQ